MYHWNLWNVALLSFSKHQFDETQQILSLRSSNQSSLCILSFIQLNVRNTRLLLPEDLIIFLIPNYFKDKWVHLASKQTCQWGPWETVPSLRLSLEINGWRSNLYIYLFIFWCIPTRLQFKKDFLLIAVMFVSSSVIGWVSSFLSSVLMRLKGGSPSVSSLIDG